MKKLIAIVLGVMLLAMGLGGAVAIAAEDDPATPNLDESLLTVNTVYELTDSGWFTYSSTHDCAPNYTGWGDDMWILTLTKPYNLTVRVIDCCCPGDFYQIYVDCCLIGTTPDLAPLGLRVFWPTERWKRYGKADARHL